MLITLKYFLVKYLEKIPLVQFIIYNNLKYFKFLLPHDKDYLGLNLLFNKNEEGTFLDVGGNIGLSTLGFRYLGFKNNEILIFEPDQNLIKTYLIPIKSKDNKIKIYPFGLSNKNESRFLYKAIYKNLQVHVNNSFSKKYIYEKIKNNYPLKYKYFKYRKTKYKLKIFDNINYKKKISFIKIDVEGYDHLVLEGMKNFLKKNCPIFLIEYNKSNFAKIWIKLKTKYRCYRFNIDNKSFDEFSKKEVQGLEKGYIFDKKYNKNSLNFFLIPKKFKFKF